MRDRLRDFGLGQAVVHADIGMARELGALTIRDQCADCYETAVTRRQIGARLSSPTWPPGFAHL